MQDTTTVGPWRDTRTLSEKLEASRKAWKPHSDSDQLQPNVLEGLVLELSERDLGFEQRGKAPFVRLLADDGTEWSVAGFHAVLRSELLRTGPRIGDRLGVIYQGQGTAKENQSPPHLYRAVVERNPEGPQEPDPELAPPADVDPDADIPF